MGVAGPRELDAGYASVVDSIDERGWHQILQEFEDANLYQTWSYASVTHGERNMSHLILRKDGNIVAIAQARIARVPVIKAGIAYILWGPLWRRRGIDDHAGDIFRQSIRALRNEFVSRRGLVLRLLPILFDDDPSYFSAILAEEGFLPTQAARPRTILMSLTPSIDELRAGLKRNWRRNLQAAEQNGLEVLEGSETSVLEPFIDIYKEMVGRKKFAEPNDINRLRQIQARLPTDLALKIMLCRSGGAVCAGLVWSEIGRMGTEVYAATSPLGLQNKSSYLLRWKLVEKLKRNHVAVYNLNGINPKENPGGYKFKSELAGQNGKDVHFLGRFDSSDSFVSNWLVRFGDLVRSSRRSATLNAGVAQR